MISFSLAPAERKCIIIIIAGRYSCTIIIIHREARLAHAARHQLLLESDAIHNLIAQEKGKYKT